MESFYFLGHQSESIQAQSCMKFGTVHLFGLCMQRVDLPFASKQLSDYLNKISGVFLIIKPCMLVFPVQEQLLSANTPAVSTLPQNFCKTVSEHVRPLIISIHCSIDIVSKGITSLLLEGISLVINLLK